MSARLFAMRPLGFCGSALANRKLVAPPFRNKTVAYCRGFLVVACAGSFRQSMLIVEEFGVVNVSWLHMDSSAFGNGLEFLNGWFHTACPGPLDETKRQNVTRAITAIPVFIRIREYSFRQDKRSSGAKAVPSRNLL